MMPVESPLQVTTVQIRVRGPQRSMFVVLPSPRQLRQAPCEAASPDTSTSGLPLPPSSRRRPGHGACSSSEGGRHPPGVFHQEGHGSPLQLPPAEGGLAGSFPLDHLPFESESRGEKGIAHEENDCPGPAREASRRSMSLGLLPSPERGQATRTSRP